MENFPRSQFNYSFICYCLIQHSIFPENLFVFRSNTYFPNTYMQTKKKEEILSVCIIVYISLYIYYIAANYICYSYFILVNSLLKILSQFFPCENIVFIHPHVVYLISVYLLLHSYERIPLYIHIYIYIHTYFKTDVQVHRPTNRYFLPCTKDAPFNKKRMFICVSPEGYRKRAWRGVSLFIPTDSIDPQTVDSANRSKKGSVCGNGTLFSREPGCPVALFGSSIGEAQTEGWRY